MILSFTPLTNHSLPSNLISLKTWHVFGMSQRTKNKTLDVVHHHRILSVTNSYKYLGVQLDQNLNIKDHTTQTYKKVCSRLQLLKRLRPKLTTKAPVTIYQSMILSLVTYCSFVTYSSELYMKKTISLHFHADQIIGNNANQGLLKSIDSTMKKHLCKHVFKILISEPSVASSEIILKLWRCIIRLPAAKLGRCSIVCQINSELQPH